MKQSKKKIPVFKKEDEEREFWAINDSTDYIDWQKSQEVVFHELKPTTKAISLRLPEELLQRLKVEANKRDIPYQSMIKMFISESMERLDSKGY